MVPQSKNGNNYIVKNIWIQGNKKTKKYIIKRELTIAVNDTFSLQNLQVQLDRSKKNVLNTKLFFEVQTSAIVIPQNDSFIDVFVEVKEQGYIAPMPIIELFDRNYKVWRKVYNGDIERIRYGFKLKHLNFSGQRDIVGINIINGFKKELSVSYSRPFIDKKLHQGIGFAFGVLNRLGTSYNDSLNAALPRKICDTCDVPNFKLFTQKEFFAGFNYQYRKSWYDKHQFEIQFRSINTADTLIKANPNYFANNSNKFKYIDLSYQFDYTKVDYFAYPLKGFSLLFGLRKRFAANNLGQLLLFAKASKNIQLLPKLYASAQLQSSVRVQKINSFYNLRSADLAFANIRGLEQYLLLSKWDAAIITNLRYLLVDKQLHAPLGFHNLPVVPLKIFVKTFSDWAWVQYPFVQANNMKQQLLNSNGIGVDIVTVYNFVIRFETTYNKFAKVSFFIR